MIVACEIGFWVLLVAGLAVRYVLRARRLSTALLLAVPAIDLVLLAVALIHLLNGGEADPAHGLAAVYIGSSIAFGPQMIAWADQRFAHRFAGGPPPVKPPRTGPEHAARERRQWSRHLLAYVIGAAVLGLFTALVGDLDRVQPLWSVLGVWTIVLVVDFVISFSYTLFPRHR